jgi:CHASE3 domain sensor protein
MEQDMSETATKKKEALNSFETVTKNIIADEIHEASRDKIEEMKNLCESEEQQYKSLRDTVKSRNLHITDCYGSYLPKEFLKAEKLDALADIMRNGTATNLNEAIQQYKNKNA